MPAQHGTRSRAAFEEDLTVRNLKAGALSTPGELSTTGAWIPGRVGAIREAYNTACARLYPTDVNAGPAQPSEPCEDTVAVAKSSDS